MKLLQKNMKTSFIPIDYDYFDFEGRNIVRIVGRNENGKKICVIDTCPAFFWAILKPNLPDKKIKSLIEKVSKIRVKTAGRETLVEKVELQNKNFLDKPIKALKIFATNYKDLQDIASHLTMPEVEKRRGYDINF